MKTENVQENGSKLEKNIIYIVETKEKARALWWGKDKHQTKMEDRKAPQSTEIEIVNKQTKCKKWNAAAKYSV